MTTYTTFSVSPQPILVRRFKAETFGQYDISQSPAFGFGQTPKYGDWPNDLMEFGQCQKLEMFGIGQKLRL